MDFNDEKDVDIAPINNNNRTVMIIINFKFKSWLLVNFTWLW